MKAVVLAAGRGERLAPLTETRPKHMIPIAGEAILGRVLKALRGAGVSEAVVVVGYLKDLIRDRFGDGGGWGIKLEYAVQEEPRGTGDALRWILWEDSAFPLVVTYGDLILSAEAIAMVLRGYEESQAAVVGAVRVGDPRPFGLLKVEGDELVDIVEKPRSASEGLVNAGVFAFGAEIHSAISGIRRSPRGEFEITDAIRVLIKAGRPVKVVEVPAGSWVDVGRPWDLTTANEALLKGIEPTVMGSVEDGARLRGAVAVGEGSRLLSGAYVEGPCVIGEDALIGPNCYIRPYTSIGDGVRIGNGCEVKNSIILDGTHIGHLSYVGDSVVGEDCNFGAGTKVANLRLDDGTVKMMVKGRLLDSGRRKLGAFIGDRVKTGLNACIMPGVKISHEAWIGPGVVVYGDVAPRTFVYSEQRTRRKRPASRASSRRLSRSHPRP